MAAATPFSQPKDPNQWIHDILKTNKQKNFVQRILKPNDYPRLTLPNGYVASHLMSWGEQNGKYYVYPTVVYDDKTKTVRQLEGRAAFKHAMDTGENIEFNDPKEADQFSKEYKKVWK